MLRSRDVSICLCVLALACSASLGAGAQSPRETVTRAIEEVKRTNPRLTVTIDPVSGLPRSIRGLGSGLPDVAAARRELTADEVRRVVRDFFDRRSAAGGLGATLFPAGNNDVRQEVMRVRKDPDIPGQWVALVEQRVGNVRVFGSSAKVVVGPAATVVDLTASMSTVEVTSVTPSVSQGDAVEAARQKLQQVMQQSPEGPGRGLPWPRLGDAATSSELVIFDPALTVSPGSTAAPASDRKQRLVWMVMIDVMRFFVDAQDKSILHYYRDQPSARVRKVFDLKGLTTFPGESVIDEAAGVSAPPQHADVGLAFDNTGKVYDYFKKTFDRDSFDDSDRSNSPGGGIIESFVRYGALSNAYWCLQPGNGCPKANVMVYGIGYAAALDIVGHEFGHGVIAHEANLVYSGEPGAVNEAIADIFGALIEHVFANGSGNWLIGERLPQRSIERPARDMSNPTMGRFNRAQGYNGTTNDGQPDHYADVVSERDAICNSLVLFDNGCVHINSGILNKLAHLIAEGGRHRGATVDGIGREKLARLVYRALTLKLNQSSNLAAAANGFAESCDDLVSADVAGFRRSDCAAVRAAVNAVGLAAGS